MFSHSDDCNSESPHSSSSDKENHSPRSEHEAIVGNTEFSNESTKESQPEGAGLVNLHDLTYWSVDNL